MERYIAEVQYCDGTTKMFECNTEQEAEARAEKEFEAGGVYNVQIYEKESV